MPAGRPTNFSKFPKNWKKIVIDMMSEGASKTEVCAALKINHQTLYNYCDPENNAFSQEFLETLKEGAILSQAWWEREGRLNLKNREFQFVGWFMNMKNRFARSSEPWRDKHEIENSGEQQLNIRIINRSEAFEKPDGD